jgi:hypothetical protein
VDIGEIDRLVQFCLAQASIRDRWVIDGDDEQKIAGHLHGQWFREMAKSLRLVPKLLKVVEAASQLDLEFISGDKAGRHTLREMDDELKELGAALAALDAGEGV